MTPVPEERPPKNSVAAPILGAFFVVLALLSLLAKPWESPAKQSRPEPPIVSASGPTEIDPSGARTPGPAQQARDLPVELNLRPTDEPARQGPAEDPSSEPATVVDRVAEAPPAQGGDQIDALCERIAMKLSSVSKRECLRFGLRATGARSVQGLPIAAADFLATSASGRPNRDGRRVLLLGGIHGDEYSSVTIMFKWLAELNADEERPFHWRILPLLNPDGLLRERSQRMNHRGVDLNRNFPTPNWEVDATDYWVRRTGKNPRRYPGPAPLSEPESRFLHEEIARFAPDVIIAVHAPLEVVDFDGPLDPPDRLGSLYLKRMGTYPGSLGRYGGEHVGLPVVTIELPSAGTMPPRAEQKKVWSDLGAYLEGALLSRPSPSTTASLNP